MPKKPPAKKPAQLEVYRQKRDFKATPEPSPKRSKAAGRLFVVQEHHARAHHYDLRLEMNGVLASWAVPKGVPEDTEAKRLAVHVEDHPVSYATFEGEIPKGNYGAGTVNIWDEGKWEPFEEDWEASFKKGQLKFILHGHRLEGPYLLARMKEEPNWLLRKLNPSTHPAPTPPTEEETPSFVAPQLARPVPRLPSGKEWLHELKYDGYRLIAVRRKGKVRLFTRSELDWTDKFSGIARMLEKVEGGDFVMDGEAVVFDEQGRSQFGDLQATLKNGRKSEISFVAFDLLNLDGRNLRRLPLAQRIEHLVKLVPEESGPLRHSHVWKSDEGPALFEQACKLGLEGIISKRATSPYHPNTRRDWVKSKCRPRQEFIICGFTLSKSSQSSLGALVLGTYENGKLVPRGKVGTGFSDDSRRSLFSELNALANNVPPHFPEMKGVQWVDPTLIAEIEFAELTREGSIRQGSFISLRTDKRSADVHLESVDRATIDEEASTVAGIEITHPDRIVFPDDGVTKLEVARYYERMSPFILQHLLSRPLALLRAPDGIRGDMFFQKSFKQHVPPHVQTRTLEDGSDILYITSLSGLISLVQYGAIEFHPWGATLPKVDKPDLLIWDLDPDKEVPWREVLGAAFLLRDFLAERGLETQVKTSGGKGLHIMLALKRLHSWDVMKAFAKSVAAAVASQNPKRFTINSSLRKRTGKIYIDWLRNGRGATCITAWGLRARPGATVSMPLNWNDLPDLDQRGFTIREPNQMPEDWTNITPQSVKKAVIEEVSEVTS